MMAVAFILILLYSLILLRCTVCKLNLIVLLILRYKHIARWFVRNALVRSVVNKANLNQSILDILNVL